MNLRELALKATAVAEDAGRHALQDQLNPHDLDVSRVPDRKTGFSSDTDATLVRFVENRLTYIDGFQGFWESRPETSEPGDRYWCVGKVDGAINFVRNMSEWAVTISLFEFNEEGHAEPVVGVVHAPALGLTYAAAKRQGAIRIRHTAVGAQREKIMPSTVAELEGSVVCYGMSYFPEESKRALHVVAQIAGKPSDIKRIGPSSLDLCKVADGTYDAYFEPHLHKWDVPAMSAGAVVVWESQGTLCQWNNDPIHWRQENDIVASNGLIGDELQRYLH
ncbi:MAG: inositol monophosphatase family protein [Bifidobacterium mongoliense]|jgi:myo-inositol-1(or 4)-monophosphatase|uniref:inositol monophosphatase family protein n=1 Tax=Bifidobacterium mongoliense TaxID=518643 RepID=UPI002F3542C2